MKTTKDKVRALVEANPTMRVADIARAVGVTKQRVDQILRRAGLETRRGGVLAKLARTDARSIDYRVEYQCWRNMIDRCVNPDSASYRNYGARGIRVCERWMDSFRAFLEDMGERPDTSLSIDRIDNNGHYGPDNCRWTTRSVQSQNQRPRRPANAVPESEARTLWMDVDRFPTARGAIAAMTGWSLRTARYRFGRRGGRPGRPRKGA